MLWNFVVDILVCEEYWVIGRDFKRDYNLNEMVYFVDDMVIYVFCICCVKSILRVSFVL